MKPGELVRSWVEAFNRADAEALAGLYAKDAVNHQVANEPVVGRAAIHRMFAEEFATASAAGRPYIQHRGGPKGFLRVLDDKIVFQRGYWDKLSFLRLHSLPIPEQL